MFDKKKDPKDVAAEEKSKSPEQKAKEAKEARDESSSAQKSEVEKSFGDDQQRRYDPKALEAEQKAKSEAGVPPSQAGSSYNDKADTHVNVEKARKAQVSKDFSKEIKIGSLVYQKPTEQNNNAPAGVLDGRPWTVLAINDGKANCLIMDPSTNRQKTEVLKISDLMTEEPK